MLLTYLCETSRGNCPPKDAKQSEKFEAGSRINRNWPLRSPKTEMRIECPTRVYPTVFLTALLAALLLVSGCTNPEKAKAAHLAKGEAYLKESKFQEASIEFRNALQIDDKLAAAHWGLALTYEGLQRIPEAFEELKRTVELDQNNLDARVKLGNYYVAGSKGRPELVAEGERLAKEVLQKDPNYIEGHILIGSILFSQNQPEKAFAELNHAIDLDPKRVESYLSLARFYVVTNDQARADETFNRAISLNGNSAMAHTEYGKFLVQLGKLPEAEAELRKAVDVGPTDRNSRFILASFYLVNKQYDKAELAYRALADLDKEKPESQAVLADFYSMSNRPDDAIKIYKDILAKSPEYLQGRYRLAEILMQRGDLGGAGAQIDEALKKDQHDRQALLLRARLRSQSGQTSDYKAAIDDLKEVLRQEPTSRPGLYFMAQVNFNLGLLAQARTYAGDLERTYPDYVPGKLMQVQIGLASGDPKGALRLSSDLIDRLSKTAPDRENTPQLITEIRSKAYLTRGAAQIQLNNLEAARQDFMLAREAAPNDTSVFTSLALVSIAENKPDEAAAFYENALSIDSTNFNALNGLITLYSRQQQFGKAHTRLDLVLNSAPNNASLHYLKALIFGFEHNAQGAESELNKTLDLDPNYMGAYYSLAALFVNSNQIERAIAQYRKLLERRPDSSSAYTLIGMLEDARKNYDAAVENYRKALELDQEASIAANNLAWLYAVYDKGNIDEAVRLAQGVVQKTPTAAGFVDTLGWIYFKKGLYAPAIEQLQKAVELDESAAKSGGREANPSYAYHLGLALKAKGDRDGAKRQLETALRLGGKVPFAEVEEARRALATL